MKTILITDPDLSTAGAADVLDRHGLITLVVSEARTALTIVRSGTPIDLVITEIQLPDMDGLAFLNTLKHCRPELPVLVVTSSGSIESYLYAVNLGVVEYLNKPVLTKELSGLISRVLDHNARPGVSFDAA